MKRTCLSLMLLCSCVLLNGQSKIDFNGQRMLKQYEIQKRVGVNDRISKIGTKSVESSAIPERIAAIVTLEDGVSIEALEDADVQILDVRDNMAIVSLPIEQARFFSEKKEVKRMSFGGKADAKMDAARKAGSINNLHTGFLLDRKYDGTGVVTGLMDGGLDPNHINFYDETGTTSRVKRVWTIKGTDSKLTSYETPSEISSFTTEDATATHGTHVAGIMAGAYKTNQFHGVAINSDIAIACGDLYNANISLGVAKVVDYAKSVGKPAVVNLSLGNNTGAHDGSDAFCQYLDKLGEDAIICIAAGNEGFMPIALNKTFTATDKQSKTFIVENYASGVVIGGVDIWSANSSPISVTPVIYDTQNNSILYSMPKVTGSTNGEWTYIANGAEWTSGDLKDANFDKAFNGYMGYASAVAPENNRYEIYFNYYLFASDENTNGKYTVGLIIEGSAGQRFDAYCDGRYTNFSSKNIAGWSEGMTDGTINNMACGKNIIAVGSYCTKNRWTDISGSTWGYQGDVTVGDISFFSSYGTLFDGRQLPHITAPGQGIVSSISTYYVNKGILSGDVVINELAAQATANNRSHYWDVEQGTSMATPYVAGTMALWLQADPTLTPKEAREIAIKTAKKDDYVNNSTNPTQWGSGKIDALAGLKEVIANSGIEAVEMDGGSRFVVTPISATSFEAYVAGESRLDATLYNMSGQPVVNVSVSGDTAEIDASSVAKGVYILFVKCDSGNYSTRVIVK